LEFADGVARSFQDKETDQEQRLALIEADIAAGHADGTALNVANVKNGLQQLRQRDIQPFVAGDYKTVLGERAIDVLDLQDIKDKVDKYDAARDVLNQLRDDQYDPQQGLQHYDVDGVRVVSDDHLGAAVQAGDLLSRRTHQAEMQAVMAQLGKIPQAPQYQARQPLQPVSIDTDLQGTIVDFVRHDDHMSVVRETRAAGGQNAGAGAAMAELQKISALRPGNSVDVDVDLDGNTVKVVLESDLAAVMPTVQAVTDMKNHIQQNPQNGKEFDIDGTKVLPSAYIALDVIRGNLIPNNALDALRAAYNDPAQDAPSAQVGNDQLEVVAKADAVAHEQEAIRQLTADLASKDQLIADLITEVNRIQDSQPGTSSAKVITSGAELLDSLRKLNTSISSPQKPGGKKKK
jgi:hypothetical protein